MGTAAFAPGPKPRQEVSGGVERRRVLGRRERIEPEETDARGLLRVPSLGNVKPHKDRAEGAKGRAIAGTEPGTGGDEVPVATDDGGDGERQGVDGSCRVAPLDGEGVADTNAALTGEHLGDGDACLPGGADKKDIVLLWESPGTLANGREVSIGETVLLGEKGSDGEVLDQSVRAGLANAIGQE